jgi:hypothetical protein
MAMKMVTKPVSRMRVDMAWFCSVDVPLAAVVPLVVDVPLEAGDTLRLGATSINFPPIGATRFVAAAKVLTLSNVMFVVGVTTQRLLVETGRLIKQEEYVP